MKDISVLLTTGSARTIGEAIASGALSALTATDWYLDRIQQDKEGAKGLNCVRSVSLHAREEAKKADAELAAGRSRGPLHGVPYLVKDNVFTTDGSFASAGASALAEFLPPYEATLVSRLRDAGAILLGKTNLTEFADFVSDTMPSEFSGAGGVVRNPLGQEYGRGQGSSIGSAAAVAAGFCAFAIGSETQNSIQAPAVYTSVVGFKPTVGQVSRYGLIPLVPGQDSPGPITRTVDDALLIFQAIAGPDMNDTATLAHFPAETGSKKALQGLRIGIPRRFMADNLINDDHKAKFNDLLALLSRAGAIIVDRCEMPAAEELHAVRSCVFRAEFHESLNTFLGRLKPCGMASMRDIIAWNHSHPEAIPYGQSLLEAAARAPGIRSPQYLNDRRQDVALSLHRGVLAALAAGNADILMSPMTVAAKCTGKAGVPVVAIPAGADADGLPFGVTVYGAPGDDYAVIYAAKAIEKEIGKRLLPTFTAWGD
ncbi:hypothetical protein LZP96_18625 [Enterobacteriaceae bacterium 155047]|uniref:amidase family protein n=1 Tax=Huaxiibacter chinensis TaxID=2899785 RepID=UPI0007DAB194|nr:amidase family protein [Huaxiibacter chinensis]ANG93837.1 hypothetical protein A8A57_16090 [Lelliottia amnigena]MCG5046041.1 hypothetical protein [Huaxiibacter chinensis]